MTAPCGTIVPRVAGSACMIQQQLNEQVNHWTNVTVVPTLTQTFLWLISILFMTLCILFIMSLIISTVFLTALVIVWHRYFRTDVTASGPTPELVASRRSSTITWKTPIPSAVAAVLHPSPTRSLSPDRVPTQNQNPSDTQDNVRQVRAASPPIRPTSIHSPSSAVFRHEQRPSFY